VTFETPHHHLTDAIHRGEARWQLQLSKLT
jgi:hypothetical protein